jgi:hypothetical protein
MDFVIGDVIEVEMSQEREIVPAGVHRMVIKNVEEGPNKYKTCDENPEGMCLKLRLATNSGSYKFVFDDIPMHLGWRAKQLADAIGTAAVGAKLSLVPADLHGAELNVEVSHYTSKSTGKVSAVVKRYVPAEKPKPVQVIAKPSAKAIAAVRASVVDADFGGDDIPF